MDYSTFDDQVLIALIAQKDADALSELYRRYKRIVFTLAFNAMENQATAEEITLDVFTRIWEHAKTYQTDKANVNTWLTRIARNRAIDVLRQQGSRGHQQTISWAEAGELLIAPQNTPEQETELSIQRAQVRRAIAQLPVEQQQALILAYVKGYSHREIAEALSQPLGTIKTRIRQAMKKLRRILVEKGDVSVK